MHIPTKVIASIGLVVALSSATVESQDAPASIDQSRETIQRRSLIDRNYMRTGFKEFKAATRVSAISPETVDVLDQDLVARYDSLLDPSTVVAVVKKPRVDGSLYEIAVPGQEQNVYKFLKESLEIAQQRSVTLIKFPPSHTFRIQPIVATGRHLKFEGLSDCVIDLNGSTLELTQASLGILLEDCQRVVLRNGNIRGVSMLASIAKAVPDDSPAGVRFEILPAFRQNLHQAYGDSPQLLTIGKAEKSSDGHWRVKVENYAEWFVNREKSVNRFDYLVADHSFHASSPTRDHASIATDARFVWLQHQNNQGHAILLDNESGKGLEDITFEDLTFTNIPGMVFAGEVVRGLHLNDVVIRADADDPTSIFAASSDLVHINANGGDIVIENSTFGPNADDKINIKGNYWKVASIDRKANSVTIVPAGRNSSSNRWGWAGQKTIFIDHQFNLLAEVKLAGDTIRDNSKRHVLTFETIPENIAVNDLIGNVDTAGARVVIRNNRFVDGRAQGIVLQTSHVVVEGNHFEGIAGPAIKLNVGLTGWYEAINPQNLLIKDNVFTRCSQSLQKSNELIHFEESDSKGRPIELISNVRVIGNRLVDPRSR